MDEARAMEESERQYQKHLAGIDESKKYIKKGEGEFHDPREDEE